MKRFGVGAEPVPVPAAEPDEPPHAAIATAQTSAAQPAADKL